MADAFIKVMEGVDFFQRETQDGHIEIHTGNLVNTLAAVQYKLNEGYELMLDPTDAKHWPFKSARQDIFFMKKSEGKEATNVKDSIPATEHSQEEEKESNAKVGELSSQELLDGPDWKVLSKMNKQSLEDEADRWNIQLDTSKNKKEMLDTFKSEWDSK